MHKNEMKRTLSFLTGLLMVGCASAFHVERKYNLATVVKIEEEHQAYKIESGESVVLQKSKLSKDIPLFTSGPSGYELLIELNPNVFMNNSEINLPSKDGSAFLHLSVLGTISSSTYKVAEDVSGKLKIEELDNKGALIQLDI